MATVFQLARVKRAVPCSSGSSQWTLDVPELTKTLLEDITHPLVVVSYFSHDQEVRDTLWTVFKELYGGIQQKRQSTGILPTGVWGWFTGTEATTSRDETRSTMTVQTLHLVYGGDEELTGQWQEEDDVGRRVEDLLCSLMVLCSTYMTVVSAGLETTQSELEKLVGSLRTLHGDGKQKTGAGTFRILCDYSIEDNKAEKMSQWIRMLWKSFDTVDRVDVDSDYPNLISGAILWCRLQACLDQLNIQELSRFDTKEMQTSVREMIRERALCVGSRAYHRAMNAYLDRRPIPLPWHTLAMVHQMAQSAACEEIEARYCAVGAEGGLMMGLKDFRKACLVTEGTDGLGEGEDGVGVKDSGLGAETGERGRVVPKGGLYLEYHSANATALQEHHTSTLNDLWQALLKNRLPGARASSAGGVDAGAGSAAKVSSFSVANSALSNVAPKIKDYKDLLLAVDQVRRGYLDRCIPSPEAVSVLDNLDDMQRSESVLFLQILAAVAASTTNANTTAASSMSSATTTNTQQQQQQAATKRGTPSKRYSITNHPTVALNGRELMIHPAVGDDTRIMTGNSMGGSSSRMSNGGGRSSSSQAIDQQQAPTELELQIADILQSKRRTAQEEFAFESSSNSSPYPQDDGEESGGITKAQRRDDEKASVQFGWTLLLRHANSLQYAWIWDWLYRHEGSSRQNVVACDSKTYTSSKWMILPAKDLIRTRKDWKIAYGDRVWLVSYWYSTRNATMELPEYLPRARGGSCGHIVPYGEAFVICRTCPADVLSSDHTNHSMYLQCSWGDSVCVCCDPARLKDGHSLHCSLHDTESERAYSGHAKGRPCEIAFNADEKVYTCKSCLIDEDDDRVLCARCFHSKKARVAAVRMVTRGEKT
ncbi:hypothetical protein BGX23_011635 [Mortierella sp. AD031]|nr:hypothetical protein BGX23_011635 [Mortierella sp. AD031]